MRSLIVRWGPAVIVMGIIFIASATPGSELPKFGIWDFFVKKGGHMIGYALLATAYYHAMTNGRPFGGLRFVLAVSLAVLYAVSDEWHQKFTPGRTPSLRDVCIDASGGFIGLALWCLIRKRFSASHEAADPRSAAIAGNRRP